MSQAAEAIDTVLYTPHCLWGGALAWCPPSGAILGPLNDMEQSEAAGSGVGMWHELLPFTPFKYPRSRSQSVRMVRIISGRLGLGSGCADMAASSAASMSSYSRKPTGFPIPVEGRPRDFLLSDIAFISVIS